MCESEPNNPMTDIMNINLHNRELDHQIQEVAAYNLRLLVIFNDLHWRETTDHWPCNNHFVDQVHEPDHKLILYYRLFQRDVIYIK